MDFLLEVCNRYIATETQPDIMQRKAKSCSCLNNKSSFFAAHQKYTDCEKYIRYAPIHVVGVSIESRCCYEYVEWWSPTLMTRWIFPLLVSQLNSFISSLLAGIRLCKRVLRSNEVMLLLMLIDLSSVVFFCIRSEALLKAFSRIIPMSMNLIDRRDYWLWMAYFPPHACIVDMHKNVPI